MHGEPASLDAPAGGRISCSMEFIGKHVRASAEAAFPHCRKRLPLPALLALFMLHGPGGLAAQRLAFELRAGVIASSALAEDAVANPALASALDGAFGGSVRAEPGTGLLLSIAARSQLRARSAIDVALGWSRAVLHAVDGDGRRRMQDLDAAQATVGIRYDVTSWLEGGCGFGMLRYFAAAGLFLDGGEISPLIECGAGTWIGPHRRFSLRALGQMHRFRTPALRDAGGRTGTVYRYGVQAGFRIGGGS